jgi:hypothetical protein
MRDGIVEVGVELRIEVEPVLAVCIGDEGAKSTCMLGPQRHDREDIPRRVDVHEMSWVELDCTRA